MGFLDLLLEDRDRRRVRKVREALDATRSAAIAAHRRSADRMRDLEDEVAFLSLVVLALVRRLQDQGLAHPDDLRTLIDQLDGLDGRVDGKLDPDALRMALGLTQPVPRPRVRDRRRPPRRDADPQLD